MEELKLWTSYVEKDLFWKYVSTNILPIFISRNISGNMIVGGWHGTAVHFPELSPSPELMKAWKYGNLGQERFETMFIQELRKTKIRDILRKIKTMTEICSAPGAVLLGYGQDASKDYRLLVAQYINSLGLLKLPVQEVIL